MSRARKTFPGVGNQPSVDRHGKRRWRLRKKLPDGKRIDTYLPGPFGSTEFRIAYETAISGEGLCSPSTLPRGTFDYLIAHYRGSEGFLSLAASTRYAKGKRLDWLGSVLGKGHYRDLQPIHVRKLMARKSGKHAANRVHKELSELFGYAKDWLNYEGPNPTRQVKPFRIESDGYHTWTEDQVDKFRAFHSTGTKARLAFEIILGTGAARQDASRMGRANIKGTDISYVRGKTGQGVDLPLDFLPELQAELRFIPQDQAYFVTQGDGTPYTVESFGNWFAEICRQAGLPDCCRAHGLRKHGAVRLAERGANEFQIMSFLAHRTTREALRYVREANRKTMAAAGLKLLRNNTILPNPLSGLGK